MSPDHILPQVLALIVCDEVIDDRITNKKSLIGLFNNISAHGFPTVHPKIVVYLALTGHGKVPVRLELVRADDITEEKGPIMRLDSEIAFNDPNAVVDMVFILNGVPFPRPGLTISGCSRATTG